MVSLNRKFHDIQHYFFPKQRIITTDNTEIDEVGLSTSSISSQNLFFFPKFWGQELESSTPIGSAQSVGASADFQSRIRWLPIQIHKLRADCSRSGPLVDVECPDLTESWSTLVPYGSRHSQAFALVSLSNKKKNKTTCCGQHSDLLLLFLSTSSPRRDHE